MPALNHSPSGHLRELRVERLAEVLTGVRAASPAESRRIECRSCGERYDTSTRRGWLLTRAWVNDGVAYAQRQAETIGRCAGSGT